MAGAAEKEEVLAEVEAVQAVYGEDCRVLRPFPPHIDVCIKPRTADDSSQQFVEAVLGIRAAAQYPDEPPCIILVESKGLDGKRQEHLVAILQNKALELSLSLMLVALCEEAVEVLSNMNHPEGNCPLCLYALFQEDASRLPFMKLMSCFHCFHSECIMRWWKWLQQQTENNVNNRFESIRPLESQTAQAHVSVSQHLGNCPVCRTVFHSKDIEHVLDLLETNASEMSFEVTNSGDGGMGVLQSDTEKTRRQKFEALLKLQEENSGLIEPRKDLVVMPGMFLPERVAHPTVSSGNIIEHTEDGESHAMLAMDLNTDSSKPTVNVHKHSSARKGRAYNPSKHLNAASSRKQRSAPPSRKQWIKKDYGMDD